MDISTAFIRGCTFGSLSISINDPLGIFLYKQCLFNWIVELFAGSIGSVAFIYTGTLIAPRFRKIVCFILLILYLIYCVNTIVKIHATYEGWEFMEWLSYSLTNIVAAIAGYMICKDQINNVL